MSDETLTLILKAGSGEPIHFKVKKTTTFKKIFDAYGNKVGAAEGSFRFVYDGVRVNANDTPKMLEIEDFDRTYLPLHSVDNLWLFSNLHFPPPPLPPTTEIDVQIEQVGGTEGASAEF